MKIINFKDHTYIYETIPDPDSLFFGFFCGVLFGLGIVGLIALS